MDNEQEVLEETQTQEQEETQADETSQDNSESDQKMEQPKIWQVVRGMQKTLKDLQANLSKTNQPEVRAEVKQEIDKFQVSLKDQMALMNAKVHEDDVEEVMDYAKYKGISLTEALKSPVIQATIKDRMEHRQTASATNTQGSKRTPARLSDEDVIAKFNEGKEVDPEALAEARINLRKKK